MSIDLDHMQTLHEEAIEQLELMKTAIEAGEEAKDNMRDSLDNIAVNHWHAYMDVVHMNWMQCRISSLKQKSLPYYSCWRFG
jgi:hypothetical protein